MQTTIVIREFFSADVIPSIYVLPERAIIFGIILVYSSLINVKAPIWCRVDSLINLFLSFLCKTLNKLVLEWIHELLQKMAVMVGHANILIWSTAQAARGREEFCLQAPF